MFGAPQNNFAIKHNSTEFWPVKSTTAGRSVDHPISATDIVRAARTNLMSFSALRFEAHRADGFSLATAASMQVLAMVSLTTCWPGRGSLWSVTNYWLVDGWNERKRKSSFSILTIFSLQLPAPIWSGNFQRKSTEGWTRMSFDVWRRENWQR